MKPRRHKHAFTLIEVMLVIVLIVGLAGLAVFALGGREEKAKTQMTEVRMKKLLQYLQEYKLDLQTYPSEEQGGLQALVTQPTFEDEAMGEKWGGPYAKEEELRDAWDQLLKYEVVEDESGTSTPRITSSGPDLQEGSEDDIKSWSEDEGDV